MIFLMIFVGRASSFPTPFLTDADGRSAAVWALPTIRC